MKENNLYNNIVYALFNCLKLDEFKAYVLLDEEFRKKYVQEICDLLGLEKDYDCKFIDDHKYSIEFAQSLVNMLNKSEVIEKSDNTNFETIDQNYVEFIGLVRDTLRIDKYSITNTTTQISIDEINSFSNFDFQDAKTIMDKLKPVSDPKPNVSTAPVVTPVTKPDGNGNPVVDRQLPKSDVINSGSGFQGANQMFAQMPGANNLPVHPRIDPRFYPYTGKPNWMIIFKKFLAILIGIAFCLSGLINIIVGAKSINLGQDWWQNKNNTLLPWFGDTLPFTIGDNTPKRLDHDLQLNLLGGQPVLAYITGIIIIGLGIFLAYYAWSTERYPRERYVMHWSMSIVYIIISAYIIWQFVNTGILGGLDSTVSNFFSIPDQYKGLIGMESNISILSKYMTDKIIQDSIASFFYSFAIICIILCSLVIIFSLYGSMAGPKLDREKLIRANSEYQKAVEFALRGEKYEMDPSLYEDENAEVKTVTINNESKWNKLKSKVKSWFKKKDDSGENKKG